MTKSTFSRRSFIKTSAAASAAIAVAGLGNSKFAFSQGAGYYHPLDSLPHTRTWMAFPDSVAIYGRSLLAGMQSDITSVANNIAKFEPVFMIANSNSVAKAQSMVGSGVTVIPIPLDDCWMRDSGPIFRINGTGGINCLGMNFNGWGNKQTHAKDALVAQNVAAYLGLPFTAAPFVSEGGAIATDGAGTLMATESSIVNPNRNPNLTQAQLTTDILAAYGATKFIWFVGIKGQDITDDHVDGTSLFVSPGSALVEAPYPGDTSIWATDENDQASILSSSTDAQGNAISVTRLGDPNYNTLSSNIEYAGYANLYPCNGGVMMIETGDAKTDAAAKSVVESAFPGRVVVQISINHLAESGGGIHCVTQQQPVPL